MGKSNPSIAATGQIATSKPQETLPINGAAPVQGANGDYVVNGGDCFCNMGTAPTTLISNSNSNTGNAPRMTEPETAPTNFAAPFGICKVLKAPCAMSNIPIWINTDPKAVSTAGTPCVTMSSFTICMAGGGVIIPLSPGQNMESFDYKGFMEELPDEFKAVYKGLAVSQLFGLDPVNMVTGNFIYFKDDIEIHGCFPLVLKRFYNAMGERNCAFGESWTHNFNIFLTEEKKKAKISFGDGHVEEYYLQNDGRYVSPPEHMNTLIRSDTGFTLTLPSMETYQFDNLGLLLSITDLNGNANAFSYENGLLQEVKNACGSLTFVYNKKGRIVKVLDHSGRVATYEYSGNYLISATHPSGAVYQYEYGENGIIRDIVNPLGISIIHNEYDDFGRTVKQSFPDGGFGMVRYDDMSAINTEQNGNEIVYVHDENFHTTQIIYDDSEERFAYNDNGKRTKYTDRNGNTHIYAYDERGNLTKETDPMGGSTVTEYNEFNKPAKITMPSGGIVSFESDQKGNAVKLTDPLQRVISFTHNSRGLVTELCLPDGSLNLVEYDNRGNILAMVDANGNRTQFDYNPLNRIAQTINAAGHTTRFEYNAKGDITKVTNAEGASRRYEYNLSGKITQITDFDGGVLQYKYSPTGKVEEVIDQMGGITKFSYDLMWNITSVTDPNGNTVRYVYDQHQRVIESIDEEDNRTVYEHDCKGNVTAVISPLGARTEIKYDALDRRQEITEPGGAITRFSYDKGGNLATVTDALGNTTKREYDLANQLIAVTDALGNKTKFTYTPLGQIECIINAKGEKRAYSYYPGGKLKSFTLPGGESESYEYDQLGNVVKVTDVLENETRLSYDSLNRVIAVTNPLGHSKKFGYDAVGNIISATDENGNVTQYKYSLLGDIIEVIDATDHSTKYGYDKMRRLTKLEQFRMIDRHYAGIKIPEYQITTYERNRKGEIVAVHSPLNGLVKYGYDSVGNMTSKLDEDGLETLYEYDLVGKLQKVSYADGKTVEFAYNELRQLTAMHDWLGTTKIEVDTLGRAVSVTDHNGKEVGYVWNAVNQREKLLYPDGSEIGYEYNPSGKLEKVLSESGITQYVYDAMGRMTQRILPDSTKTQYELNPLGSLTSLTHSKGGTILDEFKYEYDSVGNIRQIDKHRAGLEADSGVFEYAYDPVGRLIGALHNGFMKKYLYDELGNRTNEFRGGVESKHTYNARNQLIKTQEGDLVREYRYDKRGNMTQISANGLLEASYTFDATNMMVGVVTEGKGQAEYKYNGFKNRVKKLETLKNPGIAHGIPIDSMRQNRYTIDMILPYNNLLATEGSSNQRFAWGSGLISASGEDNFYYLQDHLGSPIRLLGMNGAETPLAYDEFGVPLAECAQNRQNNNPFGFTGYQADDMSGLYFAQARYYAPRLGRFGAQDTVHSGYNWYIYCYDNPFRYVDSNGLWGENVHYERTKEWADDMGFGYSQDLATQDLATDSDFSTSPFVGDQSYHFNRNKGGTDSRIMHADGNVIDAANAWRAADKKYADAMKNIDIKDNDALLKISNERNKAQQDALKSFGQGMHALQDIYAHGQISATYENNWFSGRMGHAKNGTQPDDFNFEWANREWTEVVKTGDPDNNMRLIMTHFATMGYLAEFMSQTGMTIKTFDCPD